MRSGWLLRDGDVVCALEMTDSFAERTGAARARRAARVRCTCPAPAPCTRRHEVRARRGLPLGRPGRRRDGASAAVADRPAPSGVRSVLAGRGRRAGALGRAGGRSAGDPRGAVSDGRAAAAAAGPGGHARSATWATSPPGPARSWPRPTWSAARTPAGRGRCSRPWGSPPEGRTATAWCRCTGTTRRRGSNGCCRAWPAGARWPWSATPARRGSRTLARCWWRRLAEAGETVSVVPGPDVGRGRAGGQRAARPTVLRGGVPAPQGRGAAGARSPR